MVGRNAARILACALAELFVLSPSGWTQGGKGAEAKKSAGKASRDAPLPAALLARERLSVVLGRPTDRSVTLNLLGDRDQEVFVEFGTVRGAYDRKTATARLTADAPTEVTMDGLLPDRVYFYLLQARPLGAATNAPGPEGRLRTQRAPGSEWSFQIIGDSHPERPQQFDSALYAQTLTHAAEEAPDFFLTIGDDFSVDTLQTVTKEAVESIYRRQRLYLSLVGSVAPVFLVNGNHEQAALANLDGSPDNVAVWAHAQRNALFPQPAPDGSYTGDAQPVAHIGLLRDYYAWTWGDALFVVIDPYWHSPEPVDNVLGGGAERAPFHEWGGSSPNGRCGFAARRPGWEAPIHELMAKTEVTAFIQGHDHLFANELLDGVDYITLPEPADPNHALYNADAFEGGDTVLSSGRVKVTVGPERVIVEYLREWLPEDDPLRGQERGPAYRFEIPRGGPPSAGISDPAHVAPGTPVEEDARKGKQQETQKDERRSGDSSAAPVGPAGSLHAGTLLEFPGQASVGLATAFTADVEYLYRYGEDAERLDHSTPRRSAAAGTMARDTISELRLSIFPALSQLTIDVGGAIW